jgi:transposase-like protein
LARRRVPSIGATRTLPKWEKAEARAIVRSLLLGMRERGGKVRAFIIKDTRRSTLLPAIMENVTKGSIVYTDQLGSYHGLKFEDYVHQVINHAEKYVDGKVHTNSIENFWRS